MPDTQRVRTTQQLWKLPVFALVSPPLVLMLALLVGWPYGMRLFEAYVLLGLLAPILGVTTLAILIFQFVMTREAVETGRMSRGRIALLAGLTIVSPVWLWVMYLFATGFNR
jgi:hypothetical protein